MAGRSNRETNLKPLLTQVERNCKLQQVGGTLDSKSYGIAVQQGTLIFKKAGPWLRELETRPGMARTWPGRDITQPRAPFSCDSRYYGLRKEMHETSLGSPLRSALSSAIIKLNEDGVIMELKEKWWKKERGGGSCGHVSSANFFQRAYHIAISH